MTKLEELKAAYEAAYAAWDASYVVYAAASDAAYAAEIAYVDVYDAYWVELKKQQENTDD